MAKPTYASSIVSALGASFSATLEIANFAVQLAQQDGEEVTRPLTKDQMNRAFQILRTERSHLLDLLEESGMLVQDDGSRAYTTVSSFVGKPESD